MKFYNGNIIIQICIKVWINLETKKAEGNYMKLFCYYFRENVVRGGKYKGKGERWKKRNRERERARASKGKRVSALKGI